MNLERVMEAMLAAGEAAGAPRARLIIGIAGEHQADATPYATHVGCAVKDGEIDRDDAVMLNVVAKDLQREAGEQAMGAFDDEHCPQCDSPRYVLRFRSGPRHTRPQRYECMDCDHKGPDR